MRVTRDDQSRNVDVALKKGVQFRQKHRRVDDHAVADDGRYAGIENARGNELERELSTLDHDAVPGVVTTLIADDKVHVTSQKVG